MSANPWKKLALVLGLSVFGALGAGCGSTPPCETDLSAVDAARSEAENAERALAEAKAQKVQLEKQIADEARRKEELEKEKAELQARIAELGG